MQHQGPGLHPRHLDRISGQPRQPITRQPGAIQSPALFRRKCRRPQPGDRLQHRLDAFAEFITDDFKEAKASGPFTDQPGGGALQCLPRTFRIGHVNAKGDEAAFGQRLAMEFDHAAIGLKPLTVAEITRPQ